MLQTKPRSRGQAAGRQLFYPYILAGRQFFSSQTTERQLPPSHRSTIYLRNLAAIVIAKQIFQLIFNPLSVYRRNALIVNSLKMKVAGALLTLLLFLSITSCTGTKSLKSPCVAAHNSGKNFAPCVRKPVNNVFLV